MGFQSGIGQRSKTTRLAWALKGAPLRTKDLRLNAIAAVAEGRKLRDRVTALMTEAKANPEDAMIYCVFAKPDLSAVKSERMGVTNGPSDLALAKKYVDALPIGFLVFVWDRKDAQKSIFGHMRPLIVKDRRAIQLNVQALRTVTEQIRNRLVKNGVIPDERN